MAGNGGEGGGFYNQQEMQNAPVNNMTQADLEAYIDSQYDQHGGKFKDFKKAGLWGANQAYDSVKNAQNFDPQFNAASNGVGSSINGLNGIAGQQNPYLQGFNQFQNNNNPFMQGFQNFGNQQNQHLDGMFNQGADQIQDRLNSQFGAAGRSNSGYHSGTMGKSLGDYATNFYGQAHNDQMNRGLQASQMGSNAFDNGMNRMLDATGQQNNAWLNGRGQNLDAYNSAMQGYGMQADIATAQQGAQFAPLNNYANIVGSLQGTNPPRNKTSGVDKIIGLAGAASSFLKPPKPLPYGNYGEY